MTDTPWRFIDAPSNIIPLNALIADLFPHFFSLFHEKIETKLNIFESYVTSIIK